MKSFAILPAAGHSLRMGQPKLLLPWRDSTIMQAVLRTWNASDVQHIVVIVRPTDTTLASVCRNEGVHVLVPTVAPAEMKDSVRCGLDYVTAHLAPQPEDIWLLCPCDTPRLQPHIVNRILLESTSAPGRIVVPVYGQRRGHPVAFPWSLAAEVPGLPAHEGVNSLLRRHEVKHLQIKSGTILDDMDTPDDFRQLRQSP